MRVQQTVLEGIQETANTKVQMIWVNLILEREEVDRNISQVARYKHFHIHGITRLPHNIIQEGSTAALPQWLLRYIRVPRDQ